MEVNNDSHIRDTVKSALRQNSKMKTSGIYRSETTVPAPPVMFFINQKPIIMNLISFTLIWVGTGYNAWLLTYLVDMFDQNYVNYVCSSIFGLLGTITGGVLFIKFGV